MKPAKLKQGPTREQLTDEQWSHASSLFDTLQRIGKRLAREKQQGRA